MASKKETLQILQKEFDYEDEITNNLTNVFLTAVKKLDDISEDERSQLLKKLTIIRDDSAGHRQAFAELIDFVEKDGTNNF